MKKTINIFGSTGTIGVKSLNIIRDYFPNFKINLLTANKNCKKLIGQIKTFKPNFVHISDLSKYNQYKKELNSLNIKILDKNELDFYLKKSKSNLTILSISGNSALNYIENIIINTSNLGLVNKECIVAGGNLIISKCKKYNTKLFPLDSEHFSIFNSLRHKTNSSNIKKIFLTASGGPFLNKNSNKIFNAKIHEALKHPKWKMGYKNSIDSATLANKCLEVIEAHYLFNLDYNKLDIVIHPQSLIHSIIEYKDYTSCFNYFYHDMFIPLFNFLKLNTYKFNGNKSINSKFKININQTFDFFAPDINKYPIVNIFNKMDKNIYENIIKFNTGNEFAVKLFLMNKIKFGEIPKIIEKTLSFSLKSDLKDINKILNYQIEIIQFLRNKYC
ncbi:MAG: 1-deoxy-D-xylulose 5-phosphate reductoisomerase [Alphaproteobacteria bacterium MarineAlpha5_Bin9]|nr:MAG: 1-deoxy-D-xylulose 5-phosphate reductoisomerase [Alphaproteobacteria bacterium MarineAlpha5_Bin9]|tara:strand:- start:18532 stop:19695 length:1164 start_codon:yes stop_codon:yes gene_type:complete